MCKRWILVLVFLLLAVALVACGAPANAPSEAGNPASQAIKPTTQAAWEQKWTGTLAEAKKEGRVAIYAIWTPQVRSALVEKFAEKYGISLEFSPFQRPEEVLAKVQAEQRAGLYMVDVFGTGNPSLLLQLKPQGLLASIKPLLLLPEVLDAKAWHGQTIPFTDNEGTAFSLTANVARLIVYNTGLVKEGEITTVRDLLKPQYKGKITFNDPTVSGAGNALVTHLGHNLWGEAETINYVRQLIKDQEAYIQRDNRLQIETVARGKYSLALGESPAVVDEFTKAGAPIRLGSVKEDNRASASYGAIGISTRSPHPNATIVFVNWLLTKEGQSLFATSFGNPSTRIDASIQGISPEFIPVANEKYYPEDEGFLGARERWIEIAKKTISEATK